MKSTKILKKIWPLLVSFILVVAAGIAGVYWALSITKVPMGLPFEKPTVYDTSIPSSSADIMSQWENRHTYEPKDYNSIEEIIEDEEIIVEEETNNEFYTKMEYIDQETLENYIKNDSTVLENGYEKLFIDEVDLLNTPTGIKTTLGHDILAIDSMNGIIIVGIDVPFNNGTSKVKLAIVNSKDQLDTSLVKDLSYWEPIKDHAEETKAILAVNASNYSWNDLGNYGVLYGAVKYHGTLARKASETYNVSGLSENGTLLVGEPLENLYNAFETSPILIKNGTDIYKTDANDNTETEYRNALSAIGQTEDGKTLIAVASGGVYGSNLGVTPTELMNILKQYGAYNAVCLSGGSRTMMYWNGRCVTEAVGYSENGVRLPNAIVVKPSTIVN